MILENVRKYGDAIDIPTKNATIIPSNTTYSDKNDEIELLFFMFGPLFFIFVIS